MALQPGNTAFARPITNALAPAEGPKTVSLSVDFSTTGLWTFDCTLLVDRGWLQSVQAVYIDNSVNTASVSITIQNGQTITIPAQSQAYLPVLSPNPSRLQFYSSGGVAITVQLLNVPMPSAVWSVNSSSIVVTGGKAQVQDVVLESGIVGGLYQSQGYAVSPALAPIALIADAAGRMQVQPSGPVTLISRSIAATVAAASTQLMAANGARQYMLIKAPETADLWINISGGAAGVSLVNCIKIIAGAQYETRQSVSASLINYYCVTGALVLTAFEA